MKGPRVRDLSDWALGQVIALGGAFLFWFLDVVPPSYEGDSEGDIWALIAIPGSLIAIVTGLVHALSSRSRRAARYLFIFVATAATLAGGLVVYGLTAICGFGGTLQTCTPSTTERIFGLAGVETVLCVHWASFKGIATLLRRVRGWGHCNRTG